MTQPKNPKPQSVSPKSFEIFESAIYSETCRASSSGTELERDTGKRICNALSSLCNPKMYYLKKTKQSDSSIRIINDLARVN